MAAPISRRQFIKAMFASGVGVTAASVGGATYITRAEPRMLDVTRVQVRLNNLGSGLDGFTIAQVSDWHLGEWMSLSRMQYIAQETNALNADMIVVTGDFMSRQTRGVFNQVTQSTKAFHAKEGVYGILGNHDHWMGARQVTQAIENAGNMKLLLNKHVVVRRGADSLYLAGVDDIYNRVHDLPKALAGIPDDSAVVLLAHEPDYADEVAPLGRVGLQLSGHTHGGQFRVPFVGALQLPLLGKRYEMGRYQIGNLTLYVNRGVGMVAPYVRFGCPPEITLFTLRT